MCLTTKPVTYVPTAGSSRSIPLDRQTSSVPITTVSAKGNGRYVTWILSYAVHVSTDLIQEYDDEASKLVSMMVVIVSVLLIDGF